MWEQRELKDLTTCDDVTKVSSGVTTSRSDGTLAFEIAVTD